MVVRLTEGDVRFTVNGKEVKVGEGEVDVDTRLVTYLRERLHLTGTKISCGQGGCGACNVTVGVRDVNTGLLKTRTVSSCLVNVLSCDGWEISTIEHLGSRKAGFHPVQSRLAKFHGTQCGFCSPGFVMSTNSLLKSEERPSLKRIEEQLMGNICRCTGYRPILDAMKSLAGSDLPDIEDLDGWVKVCPLVRQEQEECRVMRLGGKTWVTPTTLKSLLEFLASAPDTTKLVSGNTGHAVYSDSPALTTLVDISQLAELRTVTTSAPVKLGAAVSISDALLHFKSILENDPAGYSYLNTVTDNLVYLASPAVRDMASIAGNLMLKHQHQNFASDIFTMMEALAAKITIATHLSGGEVQSAEYSLSDWLNIDMKKKVVLHITLPPLKNNCTFQFFKVSPRSSFAYAHVNGAFCVEFDETNTKAIKKASFVFGGVSGNFIHPVHSESFIVGKDLTNPKMMSKLFELLETEVIPDDDVHLTSGEFRTGLVSSLLYKFLIWSLQQNGIVDDKNKSGGVDLKFERPLQEGSQEYQTDSSLFPVNKPVSKLESLVQCSGEAQYINDLPADPRELHAAFVLTSQANCDIDILDPEPALAMEGVVSFVSQPDIPGINNVTFHKKFPEPLFVSSHVNYAGQAVGVIVASSADIALRAAQRVKITYKNLKPLVLNIKEALKVEGRVSSLPVGDPDIEGDVEEEFAAGDKTISGEFQTGSQYHFHLETQTCIVTPEEDGITVSSSTQYVDMVQRLVAATLNIKESDINMTVRRLGGAFGGKISQANIPAAACAVAAHKLNLPVRIRLDLKTNMEMLGKRLPYLVTYRASVDKSGKMTSVKMKIYCDSGYSFNESTSDSAASFARNVYLCKSWSISPSAVLTDTASNTYARAPGSTQGHAIIENVVEHLAHVTGMDPLDFRMANMVGGDSKDGKIHPIRDIIEKLKKSSNFDQRKTEIVNFNKNNLWQKKGISLIPLKYRHDYFGTRYHVNISVYHDDGSIAVTHGGIEMGQGLNTKVCQVVARELGVSMDLIRIKPTNNVAGANSSVTGGSMGSECNCSAAVIACQKLKDQMAEVRDKMTDPSWAELVKKCHLSGVDLTAHHMGHSYKDKLQGYTIWGACVTEVLLDVLTGQMSIVRADLMEDTGVSISPEVDIGQVEGGFVMGLGMWTCEKLSYDQVTGQLLDNSTWYYHVPSSRDIPADLRTEFYNSGHNPNGVLSSKATGEPSVLAGCSVMFALRMAIKSAREDGGDKEWFQFDGPATVENIKLACSVKNTRFLL